MAKSSKPEEVRQETNRQRYQRRKDAETARRLYIALAVVGVILVGLIAAAVVQELILKPRTPIADVNNQPITTQDFAKRVKFAWYQDQNQLADPQGSSLQVLDQMVDEELVREQAQQRGLSVTEDEITERIETFFGYQRVPPTPAPTATPDPAIAASTEPTATPFPTPTPVTLEGYQQAYKDYLKGLSANSGMNEADFRALVAVDLLRQKLYEDVTKDIPATEEQVHARHILVRIIEPGPTPVPPTAVPEGQPTPTPGPTAVPTPQPRDAQQALAEAVLIKQRLDAGEDFAALAAELSEDPGSAAQGGDLGWFGRGMMVKAFEDAAFALEPGQISGPVATDFGYHIIQLLEKDPARPSDPYMLQQRQSDAFNTWLDGVRNAAKIDRNWALDRVPPTPGLSSPR